MWTDICRRILLSWMQCFWLLVSLSAPIGFLHPKACVCIFLHIICTLPRSLINRHINHSGEKKCDKPIINLPCQVQYSNEFTKNGLHFIHSLTADGWQTSQCHWIFSSIDAGLAANLQPCLLCRALVCTNKTELDNR